MFEYIQTDSEVSTSLIISLLSANNLKSQGPNLKHYKIGVSQLHGFNAEPKTLDINDDYDFLIFDHSHHPLDSKFVLEDTQFGNIHYSEISRRIALLHGNFTEYNQECDNRVYFPYYFAEVFQLTLNYRRADILYTRNDKTYDFSCLNRNPKTERMWFYTYLHQQPFFKNTLSSFYPTWTTGEASQVAELEWYCGNDENVCQYYIENILPTLPCGIAQDLDEYSRDPGFFTRDINHPAFSDSYINIISEHLYDVPFLSEKTVKPLAAAQLFLMAGPQYAIRHLEDLGFDVFRDIIDHNYYDREPDAKQRLLKMLRVANKLFYENIPEIYRNTFHRREQNRTHLFSESFKSRIFRPLNSWMNNVAGIK